MDHITEEYAMVTDAPHKQEDGFGDLVVLVAVNATAREDIDNEHLNQL